MHTMKSFTSILYKPHAPTTLFLVKNILSIWQKKKIFTVAKITPKPFIFYLKVLVLYEGMEDVGKENKINPPPALQKVQLPAGTDPQSW